MTVDFDVLAAEANKFCKAKDWVNAEVAIRRVLAAGETRAYAYKALGGVLAHLGRNEEAVRAYRTALLDDPGLVEVRSHLILLLDLLPKVTQEQCVLERRKWWACFGEPRYNARKPHANAPDPERPLKVGYVSGDFRMHSASFIYGHLVMGHSPGFKASLYSTLATDMYDRLTEVYQSTVPFYDVRGLSDDELVQRIGDDGIDVLVDLSGYTTGNRLPAFCSKPAPVQVTAWGYALGTGLDCMDAMFTDPVVFPPDQRKLERAVDLPCILSYATPPGAYHEIGPLPCLERPPTFGVYQRAGKVCEAAVRTWAKILRRIPGSRLIFKSGSHSEQFRAWIGDLLGEFGDRVEFRGQDGHTAHMRSHNDVDMMLDAFEQSGGTTTLEAMWSGVPTVTLMGKRPGARVGASLNIVAGLPQFVAQSPEEYVEIVVLAMTEKKDAIARIRAGLREQMKASPICKNYIVAVENAYRSLWREWCEKRKKE